MFNGRPANFLVFRPPPRPILRQGLTLTKPNLNNECVYFQPAPPPVLVLDVLKDGLQD